MFFDDREEIQLSESFSVAIVLAIAGGFLDAYTFICRGGVFANAQACSLRGIYKVGDFTDIRIHARRFYS